jgi:ORF6N domain
LRKASTAPDRITSAIISVRGVRVLLDRDLAALYGVTTARLNQQVRRNRERFPADFLIEVTAEESARLMLQTATSKPRRGGRRKPPLAFTEHGAIMAATVLNSRAAVEMSIHVVRAFSYVRRVVTSNALLARRVDELAVQINKRLGTHDRVIAGILGALRQMTASRPPRQRPIGFTAPIDGDE